MSVEGFLHKYPIMSFQKSSLMWFQAKSVRNLPIQLACSLENMGCLVFGLNAMASENEISHIVWNIADQSVIARFANRCSLFAGKIEFGISPQARRTEQARPQAQCTFKGSDCTYLGIGVIADLASPPGKAIQLEVPSRSFCPQLSKNMCFLPFVLATADLQDSQAIVKTPAVCDPDRTSYAVFFLLGLHSRVFEQGLDDFHFSPECRPHKWILSNCFSFCSTCPEVKIRSSA
jgi:hypothetical protein